MGKKQTSQIPNILLSVKDASVAISVSSKMVRLLVASGRLKAVNLGKRMTRISLQELTDFAQRQGGNVVLPSSSLPFNNNKREKKKSITTAKPETGNVNKRAKMSKFNIKYGRLYEIRNRYQLASVHAWGTTAFRKKDVEKAIAKYDEEQGKAQQEAYYTCFDIMQKYGLGKTQVRRFAETHGVRIKKAQMLVLLAAMIRTNPAIRGSKRLVSDRCTLIVALFSLTLQCHPKKMYPDIGNPFGIKEYNECSATISPVYSMIFAAISYSNANSG